MLFRVLASSASEFVRQKLGEWKQGPSCARWVKRRSLERVVLALFDRLDAVAFLCEDKSVPECGWLSTLTKFRQESGHVSCCTCLGGALDWPLC